MSTINSSGLRAGMAPTAFAGRTPAWHKVWEPLTEDTAQDFDAALEAGDLDWEVEKIQFNHPIHGTPLPVYGLFCSDNKQFLSEVRERYKPISNREALDFVQEIMGTDNKLYIDSCGHFQNRRKVFVNLYAGETEIVPGDVHQRYYQFVTSHDGSMHLTPFSSYVRMVCGNTVKHAMETAGQLLAIRHTDSAKVRMKAVSEWLQLAGVEQQTFDQKLKFLSEKKMTSAMVETFLDRLIGKPKEGEELKINKTTGEPRKDEKKEIREKIASAEGVDGIKGINGTAYEWLNKVTFAYDYLLKDRTRDKDGLDTNQSHAVDVSFGAKAEKKTKAWDILLNL
ncbi:MAG TPA: DUF932 domain-containing protein [Leptospiraceae bacterium]|nr:DUF932 domain-containing protein [Leptospiraceae bacterium]